MNDQKEVTNSEKITAQISSSEIHILKDEEFRPQSTKDEHKLIPRHQNKMVAETTSDMFMGGLMCE